MKKTLIFFFAVILIQLGYGQELTVHPTATLKIHRGASLNIRGLELSPTVDYTVATTAITYSGTPLNINGNPTIARLYSSTNPMNNYVGVITIHYQDGELNGLIEPDLRLGLQDISDVWGSYLSAVDEAANTVSNNFSVAVNFKGVTASTGIVLSIDTENIIEFTMYPNPVSSRLFVESKNDVQLELFDVLGKSILKSSSHFMDVENLNAAIYLLKITEIASGNSKTIRIVKK